MRRSLPLVALCLALVTGACGTQTDAETTGRLCAPPRPNCPSSTRLVRTANGRNLLDIAIENRGPPATAIFDVTFSSNGDALTDEIGGSTADAGGTEDAPFPVRYDLEADQTISDRFTSDVLFSFPELRLALRCQPCPSCSEACDVQTDFVFMAESRECSSDDECASDQFCEIPTGNCVECRSDSDCDRRQECDEAAGRCRPPSEGCGQARGSFPVPVGFLVAAGLLLAVGRRRRRMLAGAGLVVATTVAAPSHASAEPPGSEITIGAGPRWITGRAGRHVKRGVGAELRETLRWRNVGLSAWLMTDYFLTDQPPPPLINELQITGFGVGPRVFYALGPVELMAGAGFQHVGLAPNPLVAQTGTETNFATVGGTGGVAYRWSRFLLRLRGGFYPFLSLEGGIASATLSFGISTR